MNTFQFLRLKEKNKDMLTNSDIATTKIIFRYDHSAIG